MAKQLVNPIERHIEKLVVGVAGLVLLGAIARYLVTSPNQIDLAGEMVSPSTIDAKVAQKAQSIQQAVRDARPQVARPEPLRGEFERALATVTATEWRPTVLILPPVPLVDRAGAKLGQAELVKVIRLPKPGVVFGRSTFIVNVGNDETRYVPTNWATVSTLFDVKAQTERQRLAYGSARADVVYGPIELQRRAQRPGGAWSDDDWETVEPWVAYDLPRPVQIELVREGERLVVTRDTEKLVENYQHALRRPEMQLDLIRPMMPERANGTEWRFPILTSCRDVLLQDDEVLHFEEEPAASPDDRYGLCGVAAKPGAAAVQLTPAQRNAQAFDAAQHLIQSALKNTVEDEAIRAYNLMAAIILDREASAADKEKAKRIATSAEDAQNTIKRRVQLGQRGPGKPGAAEPTAAKRQRMDTQQVWANDARPGALQGGRRYQYRIRATAYNRLAGEPAKFASAEDATQLFIAGEWSEPSDPVQIAPNVEFFVTAADKKDEEIGVEMYRWIDGVWAKARRLKFYVGDAVEGESYVVVPSLTQVEGTSRILAEFSADAVVMDIDFTRPLRDRKRARGSVKFGGLDEVASVAFVDDSGAVWERFVPIEKAHPGKRAAAAREFNP